MSNLQINNFVKYWKERGYEKGEKDSFWIDFLEKIFNIQNWNAYINFEMKVDCGFIDAYLKDTRVIIEQKSSNVQLDGSVFQQAKNYDNTLNLSRKARWIVTCNFKEFLIYDMDKNKPSAEPVKILLEELPEKFHAFDFLIRKNRQNVEPEKNLNFEVGYAVRKLYEEMRVHYKNKTATETFQSLNKLCVRLVFCFYSESADIFPEFKMFSDYLGKFNDKSNFRTALIELFKTLNTPLEKRSPYISDDLKKFPYVDGGLFDDDNFDFPEFPTRPRDIFFGLAKMKWKDIDPTIFGAVFESTLNIENFSKNIRREDGIHYTTPSNIQKVIKPMFLEELYEKFTNSNSREELFNLQNEIAALKFFDPACGSGNFLTETYILLRELENRILEVLVSDGVKFSTNPIKISIENFYGIEINDFAVSVAKTALWISEIQMRQKTAEIIKLPLKHFPLVKIPNIICANALTFDWQKLISPADLNFIMSNPPFVGKSFQTREQKADMVKIFKGISGYGNLDYVACWYKKAADFVQGTKIRCAFVSTNSICQGVALLPLWKYIFAQNVHIDFVYRTFKWYSESDDVAQVHVVIIGISQVEGLTKKIFEVTFDTDDDGNKVEKISCTIAKNINAYLLDAPNLFIELRDDPLCESPKMFVGSCPTDGGGFIIDAKDYDDFIKREPLAEKYIRPYMGGEEFINGKQRFCLWLKDCPPDELRKMPLVMKRVKAVRDFRLASRKEQTRRRAETPTLFAEDRFIDAPKLFIPMLSSSNRKYIPIGFIDSKVVVSNTASFIPNATIYLFGILTSKVLMVWLKVVGGRFKNDFRFSASTVYNTFPFCEPTEKQHLKIESTAQKILDVRAGYPNATLADLYNELLMPPDLRRAHKENDAAVMAAYGFRKNLTEAEIIDELFKKYLQLTEKN